MEQMNALTGLAGGESCSTGRIRESDGAEPWMAMSLPLMGEGLGEAWERLHYFCREVETLEVRNPRE